MIKNTISMENSNNTSSGATASTSGSSNVEGNGVVSVGGKCKVCSTPSNLRCSSCNQINYCSGNHQKQDWKRHKPECRPFIIKSNEKFGRYLVAARNIKAGEIVLKELPLVYGPTENMACVGCMKGLNKNDFMQCERCGWPICQRECQNHPDHKAECDYTIEVRGSKVEADDFKLPLYEYLTTLRCLLLKKVNPKKWNRLIQLESHHEMRRQSNEWRGDYLNFVIFMTLFFKHIEWSEDEIMTIFGIILINAFEVCELNPPYVGIFDYGSLFEHSCIPNVTETFTEKHEIIFWAPYDIKKGKNLSVNYMDVQLGTVSRQLYLKKTKFFKCECERCKDVTEFGTFYSALKCNKEDCDGLALPMNLETFDQDWRCKKCAKVLDKSYVSGIIEKAEKNLQVLDGTNVDDHIRYMNVYRKYLPEHNYLICKAKLVQLIFGPEQLQTINDDELKKIMKICNDIIKLYEKLTPVGLTRPLGSLYFKMHKIFVEYSKRTNDKGIWKSRINESINHIEKTIKYLQYEPITMSEGKILAEAKIIRDFFKTILNISS